MFGFEKFGLGKYRTPFGKFLDANKITSVEFAKECGISRNTIDKLAGEKGYSPRQNTINTILKAARKRNPNVTYEELFPPM